VQRADALVLSGGSAFGLDAASGVADALRAMGRGFAVGDQTVPIVPGAILFDLINGGAKDWATNPYKTLGATALAAASETFALGTAGAGTGALIADLKGGLGSASVTLGPFTVGALVAVNALGRVTVGDGPHFWAAPFEMADEFGGLGPAPAFDPGAAIPLKGARHATTIAIVATDAALTQAQDKGVVPGAGGHQGAHYGVGKILRQTGGGVAALDHLHMCQIKRGGSIHQMREGQRLAGEVARENGYFHRQGMAGEGGHMRGFGATVSGSPVLGVPRGSISSRCASSRATGRCSTPCGTTNRSPVFSVKV
jgi:hypothetical protein